METIVLMKLSISAVLGMIIGVERELKKKPLGLKTSLVICITSCLLTTVSIEAAERYAVAAVTPMDPLRLAAQIVSGIGFLGAGVIMRRTNHVISGLTTAALIWCAAGIGISVGAGFYKEAVASVIMIMLSVEVLPIVVKWIGPKALREKTLKVRVVVCNGERLTDILKEIKAQNIKIGTVRVEDLEDRLHQMELRVAVHEKRYTTDVYEAVRKIPDVVNVKVEVA